MSSGLSSSDGCGSALLAAAGGTVVEGGGAEAEAEEGAEEGLGVGVVEESGSSIGGRVAS